jgi:hypothetical protein
VLDFGDALDRAIDAVLYLMVALAGEPGGHAPGLARALLCNVAQARDFEPTRAGAYLVGFALDLPAACGLDNDLDRAGSLDWARVVDRARFLDCGAR